MERTVARSTGGMFEEWENHWKLSKRGDDDIGPTFQSSSDGRRSATISAKSAKLFSRNLESTLEHIRGWYIRMDNEFTLWCLHHKVEETRKLSHCLSAWKSRKDGWTRQGKTSSRTRWFLNSSDLLGSLFRTGRNEISRTSQQY